MKKNRKLLKLKSFIPFRLSLLSNTVSANIAATYQDKFAISMSEWRIMAILAEYPGLSADEVCQRTQIEKSVVSRAVARLLKRHMIIRQIDDDDRRRSILRLSKTGLSIYDKVMPIAEDFEKKLIAKLSKQERLTLLSLLDKLQKEAGSIVLEN